MQNYEPPVLAYAVTEILSQITGGKSSSMPTLIVPFVLVSSKLKWESKNLTTKESKASVYGIQIGPETDITQAMAIRTQKVPDPLIFLTMVACMVLKYDYSLANTTTLKNSSPYIIKD